MSVIQCTVLKLEKLRMEATLVDIPRIKFTLALVPSAEIK